MMPSLFPLRLVMQPALLAFISRQVPNCVMRDAPQSTVVSKRTCCSWCEADDFLGVRVCICVECAVLLCAGAELEMTDSAEEASRDRRKFGACRLSFEQHYHHGAFKPRCIFTLAAHPEV